MGSMGMLPKILKLSGKTQKKEKDGSWITTNVKSLSFTEQQYLDLLAVGPMTPETVSSLQEQITQIP